MNDLLDLPELDQGDQQTSDQPLPFDLPDLSQLETAAPSAPQDSSVHRAVASNFANPMDLHRYALARMNGASEEEALKVGDNGRGKWGDDTTSFKVPMVALPSDTPGLAHNRPVRIWTDDGKSIIARVADTGAPNGRIDLNPASAVALGNTNGLKPVRWQYASGIGDASQTPNLSSPQSISIGGPSLADLQQGSELANAQVPIPQELGVIGEQPDDESDTSDMQMETDSEGLPSGTSFNKSGISYKDTGHPITMPPPDANTKIVSRNANGSITYSNGVTRWPKSGDFIMDYGNGNRFLQRYGDNKAIALKDENKPSALDTETLKEFNKRGMTPVEGEDKVQAWKRIAEHDQQNGPPPAPLHDALVNKLIERQLSPIGDDGKELTAQQAIEKITQHDKDAGIISPQQQKEVSRITTQAVSSRGLFARQFVTMYPNYKSVVDNVTGKSMNDRTGVDDAFLVSAAGGLENPTRATTGHDFALLLKTAGISGNVKVLGERLFNAFGSNASDRGTRILSDAQVKQILENTDRAIRPRYEEYQAGMKPAQRRLEQLGLNPEDYLPSLSLPDKKAMIPEAMPSPTPQGEQAKYRATNEQEYNAVPPGEIYMDAQGHLHRKGQ